MMNPDASEPAAEDHRGDFETRLHSPTVDRVFRDILGESEKGLPPFRPEGFEILETVGEGGFGVVVRARDETLEREVALKILRPEQLLAPDVTERFLGEARALAKVRHSNVLTIYSVIEDGPHVALVMEFLDGEPLSSILERQGPFGGRECAQIGIELCQALAAVHHAGLVHRDVKTPNIVRERGGRIVLTDFGLGACVSDRGWVETGFVAGSPLFMAPEQIDGRGIAPRTDLYGLGVVLYNLSTGRFPAVAKDLPALFQKVRTGALTALRDARPDLPKGFTDVVMRALRADPGERYQTAGEMEDALTSSLSAPPAAAAASSATTAVAPATAEIALRRASLFDKRPLYILAATALVVAGLLVVRGCDAEFRVESLSLRTVDSQGNERVISEGGTVGVDSLLFLDFRADTDLHVYVLNEDERGRRHLLFPMRESELENPLSGGKRHRLPGTAQMVDAAVLVTRDILWKVDTVGGEEQLLIIASLEAIQELEALARSTASGESAEAYPAVRKHGMEGILRRLRGIGGKAYRERRKIAAGDERLARFIEELSPGRGTQEVARGVWVRRITLRNPGPAVEAATDAEADSDSDDFDSDSSSNAGL